MWLSVWLPKINYKLKVEHDGTLNGNIYILAFYKILV